MSEQTDKQIKDELIHDLWSDTELEVDTKTSGYIHSLSSNFEGDELAEYVIKDNIMTIWTSKDHYNEIDYSDIECYIIENHFEELGIKEEEVEIIIKPYEV